MDLFDTAQQQLSQQAPTPLVDDAASALDALRARGLPQKSDEAWRKTDLGFLSRATFSPAPDAEPSPAQIDAAILRAKAGLNDAVCAVFIDGRFDPERSPPPRDPRVTLASRAALSAQGGPLPAHFAPADPDHAGDDFSSQLAAALGIDGAIVEISAADGDAPACLVQLIFVDTGRAPLAAVRHHITLCPGARAAVVESYVSAGPRAQLRLTASETLVEVQDDARLEHHVWFDRGASTSHFAAVTSRVHARARYAHVNMAGGGQLCRTDLDVALLGAGAQVRSDGLMMLDGATHFDAHTRLRHLAPGTHSDQLYKGVLRERSHGVFHGLIRVEKDAQKIDARQASHHLLLSDDAVIDTNPQLEIFADDVKCAHGSTVGQLDEDAVFYCTSRGIEEHVARALLTRAFVSEVIARCPSAPLQAALRTRTGAALGDIEEAP